MGSTSSRASRGLGIPTTLDRSVHKSTLLGKKQADIDTPLGTWSVRSSVITIMGITIIAALAMKPTVHDLKVVDLWSGVEAIMAAAEKHNCNIAAFDFNQFPGVGTSPCWKAS